MARTKYATKQLTMLPKAKPTTRKTTTEKTNIHERTNDAENSDVPKTFAPGKPCASFCCSPFLRFKDEELKKSVDLNNPIHPIFRRENFSKEIRQRHYKWMEQSLRLASHLLESNALVPYLNTMFDGEVRNGRGEIVPLSEIDQVNPDGSITWGWDASISPKPGQDEVNPETKQRAKEILERMAEMVTFDLIPDDESDFASGGAQRVEGPLPSHIHRWFPRGCRTSIRLLRWKEGSPCGVDNLTFFSRFEAGLVKDYPYDQQLGADEMLMMRFYMAQTLVHEVGHALSKAAHGFRSELFYRDGRVAEAGFDVEKLLFGGETMVRPPWEIPDACEKGNTESHDRIIVMREWPSPTVYEDYAAAGTPLAMRSSSIRSYEIIWRIPLSYIESLFTNEFWNGQAKKLRGQSQYPPKVGSWHFWANVEESECGCVASETWTTRRKRAYRKAAKALKQ